MMFRVAIAAAVCLLVASCGDDAEDSPPEILPDPMPAYDDLLTPEFAGYKDARRIPFSHYQPAPGCTLDVEARDATCDVSGCTVPNLEMRIGDESTFLSWLTCEDGAPPAQSGIDFAESHVLFVRQGTQVGEWLRPAPVAWVVDDAGTVIVAERREAFCIEGSTMTGDVVSYALILPVSTATQTLERKGYRNPRGCDVTGEEGDGSG